MEVYFDNSATTQVFKSVNDRISYAMTECYGNPSSMHKLGFEAENLVKEAKHTLARLLKAEEKELYFTSGGTEANNLALIGTARANKRSGNHIITTKIEHPSVLNTVKYLEEEGFRVTFLDVDAEGRVSLEELEQAICEDTILVSVMFVNNEIGTIEPIEEISQCIKRKKPNVIFHVDGVQAFGKLKIFPKRMGIDLFTASGHKIHGPKGIGLLYCRSGIKIKPISYGGGQQDHLLSGTLNVPGIVGLAKAAEEVFQNLNQEYNRMYELKEYFTKKLLAIEGTRRNGPEGKAGAPHIVNVSFRGVRSEVFLHALEEKEIYVSSGSACSSHKQAESNVLRAIHVPKEYMDCAIRFSFSIFTTREEMDYCIKALQEQLSLLRKFSRY